MRPRNIRLRDVSSQETLERQRVIKDKLRERFKRDPAQIDEFIDKMLATGWTVSDFDSAMMQAHNTHRPAVEVALFKNEPLLAFLRLQQARFTDGRDTAMNPNYAIRHLGQWETIQRRQSVSDALLVAAAHNLTAKNITYQSDKEYWDVLWYSFIDMYFPTDHINAMVAATNPAIGFAMIYRFAAHGIAPVDESYETELRDMFFSDRSYECLWLRLDYTEHRERVGDNYVQVPKYALGFDMRRERNLSKACIMVLSFALDRLVENITSGESARLKTSVLEKFFEYISKLTIPQVEILNDNQEAQERASERNEFLGFGP